MVVCRGGEIKKQRNIISREISNFLKVYVEDKVLFLLGLINFLRSALKSFWDTSVVFKNIRLKDRQIKEACACASKTALKLLDFLFLVPNVLLSLQSRKHKKFNVGTNNTDERLKKDRKKKHRKNYLFLHYVVKEAIQTQSQARTHFFWCTIIISMQER